MLYSVTNESVYKDCSIKNIEFSLDQQLENGWFPNNCLNRPDQPLLHTIAYSVDGVLEVGCQLNNEHYILRARKMADSLALRQQQDGSLAGRFNNHWQPTVKWSCLAGNAQMSVIWWRLFQITGDHKYLDCMDRINQYLMKKQFLGVTRNSNLYSGIAGSDPVSGGYHSFQILSWAVKFFMDACMLRISINNLGSGA